MQGFDFLAFGRFGGQGDPELESSVCQAGAANGCVGPPGYVKLDILALCELDP